MSRDLELQEMLDQEVIETAQNNDVEFAIFELLDTRDSGWIKEGTENLPSDQQQQKRYPESRKILNESAYAKWKDPKNQSKGYTRVETRYIFGAQDIETSKLDAGLANSDLDQIIFKNGRLIVTNEGNTASLYKFMKLGDSRNATNPNRIPGVEPVYCEVFPEKEKENAFEDDFDATDAIAMVRDLVKKNSKGVYEYQEERLVAWCKLFGIAADSNAGRVTALVATAKHNPIAFVQKVQLYEQEVYLEIAHGLELGVIVLDNSAAVYPDKEKIITSYSNKLTKEEKIKSLGRFFMSEEGKGEYKLFQTELTFKKQQSLNN